MMHYRNFKTVAGSARFVRLRRVCAFLSMLCLLAIFSQKANSTDVSDDERTLWNLERAYWRYVENNDLAAYRNLWHKDFLGWPSVSSVPVRKDHITDWITSQTSKGLAFKAGEFQACGPASDRRYRFRLLLDHAEMGGRARQWRSTHVPDGPCMAPERKGMADHRWHVHA